MAKLLIGNLKPPIATTSREGISKPDGTTIGINAEGTLSSLLKASGLNITDTEGLVGETNEEVTTQALINAIADKVANQLVSNNTLTTQLANYVTKSMIKTDFEDSTETVPASSLVNQLNSEIENIGAGEWTFAGSATGTSQTINFPNTYNELAVYATYSIGTSTNVFTWHVVRPLIDNFSVLIYLRNGYGYTGSDGLATVEIHKDNRIVKLVNFFYDSQDVAASGSIFVYYR